MRHICAVRGQAKVILGVSNWKGATGVLLAAVELLIDLEAGDTGVFSCENSSKVYLEYVHFSVYYTATEN